MAKIPESKYPAIAERYKECESTYVVAKEYGVSAPTINNVLDKLGVKRIGQYCNHKIEVSEYAYIEQLCREGNSAPIIAAAYGVTVSTIYWILDKLGIKRYREQKIPESAYPAIAERYKECENARIVGEEYGVSKTSIRYILKKLGVEMVGGNPPSLAESLYPAIVKRYKECESSYVVAKEYGVSKRTILDILIKLGVERTGKPRIPTSDYPAIVKRYKECESTITVGKEYGVDDSTIGNILERLGVERTGKRGPKVGARYGIIPTNTTKADHLRTLAANGYIFEI